jgi:hypothetical protein
MQADVKGKEKWRFKFWYYRQGERRMILTYKGETEFADEIRCWVPCESHMKATQPRCIMRGWAHELHIQKINGKRVAIFV